MSTAVKAVQDRLKGTKPGVFRAAVAAATVGVATAVLTYRALRSG